MPIDANDGSLKEALEGLSSKKHVVRELPTQDRDFNQENVLASKDLLLVKELQKSLNLLLTAFDSLKFDDLLLFIAKPFRMLLLHFLSSFIRGVAFALGVLLVFLMFANSFFPKILINFML